MRHRVVPRTGRRLSEITFGAGTAAGLMVHGDPAEQRAVVERALDLGAQPLTARHAGPYGQSHDLPHLTLDELLGEGGAWETVAELIADGVVGSFGISGWDTDPDLLRALIGAGVLDIANQPLNLLNPTAVSGARGTGFLADVEDDFVDFDHVSGFAADNGCALAVISPVAAGVLTVDAQGGRTPPAVSQWRTRFPAAGLYGRELRRAAAFVPLAEQAGMTLTELAYRFTLSVPAVVTVLGGFSSAAQVEEAVRAADRGPLPPDVLAELDRLWLGG